MVDDEGPASIARARGVDAALQRLVGLRISAIGRAATLLWVQFGEQRPIQTLRGTATMGGEFALHTEDPWRLLGPADLITGNHDMFYDRAGESDDDVYTRVGTALVDVRLERFRAELEERPISVRSVALDRGFCVILDLDRDHRLEIVPTGTSESESWRLFRPGFDEEHLVVGAPGIEPG